MAKRLSFVEAYMAMYDFLNRIWEKERNAQYSEIITDMDPLSNILSDLLWAEDRRPFDLAYWRDFEQAVERALGLREEGRGPYPDMTTEEAYMAMSSFLQIYNEIGYFKEIDALQKRFPPVKKGKVADAMVWRCWEEAVDKATRGDVDI